MPFPTLGGPYLWQDRRVRHSWRLQKRVGKDRWRVLDPGDWRQASGSREEMDSFWRGRVEPELAKIEARDGKPEKIVLFLHGILEFKQVWFLNVGDIRREAKKRGLPVEAWAVNYASTRRPIEYFVEALAEIIDALPPDVPLCAVCHSMGGLILNKYLDGRGRAASEGPHRFESIAYLGTPFAGSPYADKFKRWLPFRLIFGPAGQQLGTAPAFLEGVAWPDCPTVCVAGSKPPKGFFPWDWVIKGDDDGVVPVSSALPEQAGEHMKLKARHEVMFLYKRARNKVVEAVLGPADG